MALVAGAVLLAAPAAASAATRCGDAGTPAVVALHESHFYVDSASTALLLSGYAGYRVDAGVTGRPGLWLQYSGFSGGVLGLASQQPAAVPLPAIVAGGSAVQYALLTATGVTAVPQTHTVTVYDGPPSVGAALCSRTFTYADVVDTIKALANKVQSVTTSAPAATAQLGDVVTVTVIGNTGTLGAGPPNDPGVLSYTPNALGTFPVSAWRLERTELTISPDGVAAAVTYVDRLYLSGASGPARPYTARYTFRAVGPSAAAADVKPIQYIASGTQVKHTDAGGPSLGALPAVSAIAPVTAAKTVTSPSNATLSAGGGTATYALTLTNAGSSADPVDYVGDTLPSGATFDPGSLTVNGRTAADPDIAGGRMVVRGPLTVPAAGTLVLTYRLQLDATPGRRTNAAVAYFGGVVLDATADTRTSAPASADVTVLGPAGLNPPARTVSTSAGTPVTTDLLTGFTAPSGRPVTVTAVGTPGSGSAVINTDGTVTYTPAAGASGNTTFTYTASDGTSSGTATVTAQVNPVAGADLYSTGKNVTLTASSSVLANDACTTCTVSTTLVTGPRLNGNASGTVTMAANGTFTYAPASNATGTVTFTYRATDGAGRTTDGEVTVNVADLAPDYFTTAYQTAISPLDVRANDPGCTGSCKPQAGAASTLATVTYPTGNASTLTYTPRTGVWGLDSFTYGVTGNTGGATTPVTVLIGPPASTLTTTYNTAATAALPAGGTCTGCAYAPGTTPVHGSVTVNPSTGASTYRPAAGYAGTDTYTYLVSDPATGLRRSGTVTVTVGPQAVDDTATVLAGGTVTGNVSLNDACPATCTRTKLTSPASGTATLDADGTFSYTAGTTIGTASFTYRVASSVSGAASSDATVRISVGGAADDTATTSPGQPVTVPVMTNDPCAGCAITALTAPAAGTATISGTSVVYTPGPGFSGQVRIPYTLTQGAATTTATATVTVTPRASTDTVTAVAGTPVDVLPLTNDLCANCALTAVGTPGTGSAMRTGDTVRYTPAGAGSTSFTYSAVDGAGNAFSGTVNVTVVAAPALTDDTASTAGRAPVTIPVLTNDTCTGCTVTIAADPASGTVLADVHGHAVYLAAPGFSGVDTFDYTATDPATGAYATARVTVTVSPVAEDDTADTRVGAPLTVDALANDACTACTLTVGAITGTVTAGVGTNGIDIVPGGGWTGVATVAYTATDPSTGLTSTATVTVDVNDARPDSIAVAAGASVTGLDVLANDFCPGCTVTAVTTPTAGTAGFTGATVTWQPPAGFAGLATFDYTATSGGQTVTATVRILAAPPVRTAAVVVNQPGTVQPFTGTCAGCVVTPRTAPSHGDVDPDGSGGLIYTPQTAYTGTDTFDYRVTDPVSGRTVDATATVTVAPPAGTAAVSVVATVPTPATTPAAGNILAWQWTVTNTGSEALTGLTPTPAATCTATSLAVGAATTCSAPHTVTQPEIDAGQSVGALSVTASSNVGPATGSDSDTVTLTRAPALSLTAAAALDSPTPTAPAVGDLVRLTYTVTNTGNTTLTAVAVTTNAGALSCTATTRAPGAATTCTGAHTITQPDLDAGLWGSSGTASATSPGPTQPTNATDSTSTTLPAAPQSPTAAPSVSPSASASPSVSVSASASTSAPASTSPSPSVSLTPSVSPSVSVSASPSATASPTPSVSASTPAPPPGSTVVGTVWFDRNQDGRRDPGEWPLPGVPVELRPASAAQAATLAAIRRTEAAAAGTVTDADGNYRFTAVPAGSYQVTAAVSVAGFSYTSDSDGIADWSVAVTTTGTTNAEANFAGVGKGSLAGTIYNSTTQAPIADAAVTCRWAGLDDRMNTADDVLMTVTATGAGGFGLTQLPYGQYQCNGRDPVTGAASATATVPVMSPQPARADLPIRTTRLAVTGPDLTMLTGIGLALLLTGAGAISLARRRYP